MPLDYTSGSGEDPSVDYPQDDSGNYILPADKHIRKLVAGPNLLDGYIGIDSLGEKYRDIVEFDLNSEAAYDGIVSTYPDAWDTYYGGSSGAPDYTPDNALQLKEALAFYLWITEDEEYGEIPAEESIDFAPYIREEGSGTGTYEHPNAFYDTDVYNRVTNDGDDPLPRVELNSERTIASTTGSGRDVDYAEIFSAEQLQSTEYETVRKGPQSFYDWGGPYATGKKTF